MWDIGICGDFTLYEMDEMISFWRHILWNSHDRCQTQTDTFVLCHDDKKISLTFDKNSYDKRNQV